MVPVSITAFTSRDTVLYCFRLSLIPFWLQTEDSRRSLREIQDLATSVLCAFTRISRIEVSAFDAVENSWRKLFIELQWHEPDEQGFIALPTVCMRRTDETTLAPLSEFPTVKVQELM